MFEKRTFRNQHEDTAENRAIIKINGDSISGAEDFCDILAEMTVSSNEAWGDSKAHATNHVGAISQWIGQGIRSRVRETRTKIRLFVQMQVRFISRPNAFHCIKLYKEVNFQSMDDDE